MCILVPMRRLSTLLLVAVVTGCVGKRDTRPFDELAPSGVAAGAGSGGASSVASAASGVGSSSSTGPAVVADCHCIHEIFHAQACQSCEIANRTGVCASQYNACLADSDCTTFIQQFCPAFTVNDDPAAVAQCLNAGAAAKPLLVSYFSCICNNPGPCEIDCQDAQQCGQGGAGGAGGAGATSSSTSASTTAASTGTGA